MKMVGGVQQQYDFFSFGLIWDAANQARSYLLINDFDFAEKYRRADHK